MSIPVIWLVSMQRWDFVVFPTAEGYVRRTTNGVLPMRCVNGINTFNYVVQVKIFRAAKKLSKKQKI